MEAMGKVKRISASWFSLTQHTSPLSGFIQNLKSLALIAGEKSVVDFYEKERNIQIKGIISRRMLNISDTIQQVKPNFCTNFSKF